MHEMNGARIALFTHDTFGLGHVRRCTHLMGALAERAPDSSQLLITGSPALPSVGALPPNADYVKIPTVVRTGDEAHRPNHLRIPLADTTRLRSELILAALRTFEPHVLLVDNFPLGSRRELLGVLDEIRAQGTRTVLGLRDIVGHPQRVRADWRTQGTYDVLTRSYDRILVYGPRDLVDVVEAYGLPPEIEDRVEYCGYVTDERTPPAPSPERLRGLGLDGPFVLATGGGGGDAYPLLSQALEAADHLPDLAFLVVTGPLMSTASRETLVERARHTPTATVVTELPDLRSLMGSAAAVVSMCGYNTAVEVLASGAPAVVVPRTWRYGEHHLGTAAGMEWEQLLRARALARHQAIALIEPDRLDAATLVNGIRRSIDRGDSGVAALPQPMGANLDLGGRHRASDEILKLLGTASGSPEGSPTEASNRTSAAGAAEAVTCP